MNTKTTSTNIVGMGMMGTKTTSTNAMSAKITSTKTMSTKTMSTKVAVTQTGASGSPFFLVLLLGLLSFVACSDGTTNPSGNGSGTAALQLSLRSSGLEDPRTYSVGRVQLRALDMDDEVVNAQIFEVDRATGLFALDFTVSAGPDRTLLVEPLGSAVLPDGGKTNSGVALQAIIERLDIVPDEVLLVEAVLEPFIPDSVFVGSRGELLELFWSPMPIAESHRIRVIETDMMADTLVSRLVDVPREDRWDSILIDRLRSPDSPGPLFGFQVQSINRFAESAFSDTAFYFGP